MFCAFRIFLFCFCAPSFFPMRSTTTPHFYTHIFHSPHIRAAPTHRAFTVRHLWCSSSRRTGLRFAPEGGAFFSFVCCLGCRGPLGAASEGAPDAAPAAPATPRSFFASLILRSATPFLKKKYYLQNFSPFPPHTKIFKSQYFPSGVGSTRRRPPPPFSHFLPHHRWPLNLEGGAFGADH